LIRLRVNLGGEGEEPDCINQQPPWVDSDTPMSRTGQPMSILTRAGVPMLFCDNLDLPFPDGYVDEVITNNVPVDLGMMWQGPSLSSNEIKRILKSGGAWFEDGRIKYRKP
jgi:hypothetical protein